MIKEAVSLLASVGVKKASSSHYNPEAKKNIISPPPIKRLSPYGPPRARTPTAPPPASHSSKKNDRSSCSGCRRFGHTSADCFQLGHSQFNAEAFHWLDSTNGKALLVQGILVLPREKEEGRPGQGNDSILFMSLYLY
jgi:hypothetical protein